MSTPETPTDPPAAPTGTDAGVAELVERIQNLLRCDECDKAQATMAHEFYEAITSIYCATCSVAAFSELRKVPLSEVSPFDLMLQAAAALAQQATQLQDWRSWAQFVYLGGGAVTVDDKVLRSAVCAKHDEDVTSLRAELETAQQAREREKR